LPRQDEGPTFFIGNGNLKTERSSRVQTVQKKIKDLKIAGYNPRKISQADMNNLMKSIKEFGMVEPVVVNKDDTVIGGHQRIAACEKLGIDTVPVIYMDLTKRKEKLLNLALNRIHGDWDDLKLGEIFQDLKITADDPDLSGFSGEEIDEVLSNIEKICTSEEAPILRDKKNKKPKCKFGEVYQVDRHRVMCGSSTDKNHIKKLMGGRKADLVFADPPYNVGIQYRTYKDDKPFREYIDYLKKIFGNVYDIMNKHRYIFITIGRETKFNVSAHVSMILESLGYHFEKNIYWIKPLGAAKPVGTLKYPFPRWYEPILRTEKLIVYCNELDGNVPEEAEVMVVYDKDFVSGYRPEKNSRIPKHLLTPYVSNVWRIQTECRQIDHPAPKPLLLLENVVNFYSLPGENVMDPFGGSGTTLLACEKLGRNAFILELDPMYCDLTIDRYHELKAKERAN